VAPGGARGGEAARWSERPEWEPAASGRAWARLGRSGSGAADAQRGVSERAGRRPSVRGARRGWLAVRACEPRSARLGWRRARARDRQATAARWPAAARERRHTSGRRHAQGVGVDERPCRWSTGAGSGLGGANVGEPEQDMQSGVA
jgi:hypothetical protein